VGKRKMGIEQYKGKQMSNKTETELNEASDAEMRKWDICDWTEPSERDRADEEYQNMLKQAAVMRESTDEQTRIKPAWKRRI